VATGVLLLPEHNPVIVAKRAASLDFLSDGRLVLGVGIGWSREEFDALGIPFARRGLRTNEYVQAMRVLWREDVASFAGEFVAFSGVRVNPKPVRRRKIPIVVGGNSDVALRRVAQIGDGWYGFNLPGVDAVHDRLTLLREFCQDAGRDVKDLDISVALENPRPEDLAALNGLGVRELVLVDGPPEDASAAEQWVAALGERWNAA
jgi:probable F420-dependent oxidoreductase